ncbi:hypothetical protein EJ02DRAFT_255402 [Clathrospora elynae]|uniref:Uncharacterized protein n=1 Tax=Clathrospora elynae TaxID=706981 RepID=A0A6A5SIX1_9PLEO|nr:hypothetical protein EJ02DRAFT_255402 [Clathrospora elynae]
MCSLSHPTNFCWAKGMMEVLYPQLVITADRSVLCVSSPQRRYRSPSSSSTLHFVHITTFVQRLLGSFYLRVGQKSLRGLMQDDMGSKHDWSLGEFRSVHAGLACRSGTAALSRLRHFDRLNFPLQGLSIKVCPLLCSFQVKPNVRVRDHKGL